MSKKHLLFNLDILHILLLKFTSFKMEGDPDK